MGAYFIEYLYISFLVLQFYIGHYFSFLLNNFVNQD